ncbi:MAG: ATP-binding cassette domain-containing protein [Spirochaetia bacterium]|nr:ATP-binding cassette domain-containing protein [Spirochaetia bacterium]
MISVNNLTIEKNKKKIVKNISFFIKKGETTCLSGRSGGGKTSILMSLMGFLKPNEGIIEINNLTLCDQNIYKIREQLSWLPQSIDMGHGTVYDTLMFPFSFHINKKNTPSIQKIKENLTKLKLNQEVLKQNYNTLSGGEKQRIALLLCFLLKKPLIILDEPTSALDKISKKTVFNFIKSHKNITIISSSHDKEWISFCDKTIKI